jgi:N-acetylmuramoyl-L-alanine amidase
MELSRRDVLPQTALATTRSPAMAAGTPSAATYASLRVGSDGSPVLALQRRLTALGYWLGGVDGAFGDLTRQAVVAIQKVSGLSRDGICGPLTWSRVDAGSRPRPRSATGHVIEIATTTQTLLVVDSGVVTAIYNTSAGSGKRYFQGGNWHIALTPPGMFNVIRRVDGWDPSPLGSLYRPAFFNDGIAIHGYTSVPSTPASHGCVRVSLRAMDNLWGAGAIQLASCVLVYS